MNISQLPDEDLAVYVREVDLASFHEIVTRFEVPLLKYARYLVPNELKAHEIVQKAFINVYTDIFRFNPKDTFSSFIFRAVHSQIEHYYQNNKQGASSFDGVGIELFGDTDIENEFSDRQLMLHIMKFSHKLPLMYREPVVLHFLLQKSYDEVMDILQISRSAVTIRISVGKSKISDYAQK